MAMPSQPRTTRPLAMSWAMMSLAMLIGIENPMPWPVDTMAVLMPTTRPSRFSSGPPELPGLIEASVWMNASYVATPTRVRPVAEMMPAVTVRSSPNGLPMAMAHWPMRSLSESPSSATGRAAPPGSTLSTARSVFGSRPTMVAGNFLSSDRRTSISPAFSTTWLLVRMKPRASTMTPEPLARPSSRGCRRRKKRSKNSGPKNSRKRCSDSGDSPGPGPPSGTRLAFVLTLTTAGVTRSATETNASSRACRMAFESSAGAGRVCAPAASASASATTTTRASRDVRARRVLMTGLLPRNLNSRIPRPLEGKDCHFQDTPRVRPDRGAARPRRSPTTQLMSPSASSSGMRGRSQRGTPRRSGRT